MSRGIPLSKKHGVNPSVTVCQMCGKDIGLALFGRLEGDAEAPRQVLDPEPCDECKSLMEQGVMLIEVDVDKTDDEKNPWRTGRIAVLRDEAISRIFDPESAKAALERRVAFVEIAFYERLGLHEAQAEEPSS
jgi:hypothetical protein